MKDLSSKLAQKLILERIKKKLNPITGEELEAPTKTVVYFDDSGNAFKCKVPPRYIHY